MSGSGMKMLESCRPARLKVLLGAVHTMALRANSSPRLAKGTWAKPGRAKSAWISSATTTTLWRRQICPMRRSSSAVQQRPTGLWGLQRMKSLAPDSTSTRSKPS